MTKAQKRGSRTEPKVEPHPRKQPAFVPGARRTGIQSSRNRSTNAKEKNLPLLLTSGCPRKNPSAEKIRCIVKRKDAVAR